MVVEDADRLTDQAGNALLKAIEEPTPHTVWLLCAPAVDDVLPTVRSRCRHLSLRTPPTDAVADVLVRRDGVDPAMASFAARAAQGHIGRARRLATDEEARLRRHAVLRLPLSLGELSAALRAAGDLVDAATAEANEQAATLAASEADEMRRGLGVGPGARQPAGAAAQLKELESEQKKRATRTKRDAIDRALIDLAGFYRDVLAVQAQRRRRAGERRDARRRRGHRPVVDARGDAAPDRRDPQGAYGDRCQRRTAARRRGDDGQPSRRLTIRPSARRTRSFASPRHRDRSAGRSRRRWPAEVDR